MKAVGAGAGAGAQEVGKRLQMKNPYTLKRELPITAFRTMTDVKWHITDASIPNQARRVVLEDIAFHFIHDGDESADPSSMTVIPESTNQQFVV